MNACGNWNEELIPQGEHIQGNTSKQVLVRLLV